jgi:translation initiation factor IF-2
MAEVTVEQLATTVGTGPDKLLSQMKDAGLPHKKADEVVSDDDKRTLLAHLKRSHGSAEEAPRKITLKRKSLSTLKAGGSSGKRTVNVEVRKKRTYVKRPEAEEVSDAESAETGTSADEVVELTSAPELVADAEGTEVAAESVEIEAPWNSQIQ